MNLPTAPAKATDRRSFDGIEGDPTATVQAESIPPDRLAEILRTAIENLMDLAVMRQVFSIEDKERDQLETEIARLNGRPRGRPSSLTADQQDTILALHENGIPIRAIADRLGLSKSSVGRFLKR